MSGKPICFVISPIGEPGSEVRKRADQVLKHVLEPAAERCGYEALRSDKISEPGQITNQVIQHILDDPMVIADLTDSNGNVFYELALRHAIRKPLVQLISEGEKIPFDVAGMRTISVNHRDLDSAQQARQEIEKQIEAVEHKKPEEIDSPITVALDFQTLRQSGNPEQRSIAEFAAALTDIRSSIVGIQMRLSETTNTEFMRELEERHLMIRREGVTLNHLLRDKLEQQEARQKQWSEEIYKQLLGLKSDGA